MNQNVIRQLDGENRTNLPIIVSLQKHLNKNIQHSYNWTILANGSKITRTRKTLLRTSLNDQLKSNKLLFFRK